MTVRKIAVEIEGEFCKVSFTELQLGLIVRAVEGKETLGNYGSSKFEIENKIYKVTGWSEMKFIQLCCRFAYKHGLVRL